MREHQTTGTDRKQLLAEDAAGLFDPWLGRIRLSINDGLLGRAYHIGQSNPETIYKMKYLLVLGKQNDRIEGVDPNFDGSQEQAEASVMDFCPTG